MEMFFEGAFWIALSQIMLIDLVLAGDNAVVIALACRNLPPQYRRRAIMWGSAGAIILRFIFCIIVAWLLLIPFLKLVGAVLLLWIGIKLVAQEEGEGDGAHVAGKVTLWGAIQTIIIADAVMSLDNAIGIAAAATKASGGDEVRAWALIITGLLITIPIIVFGSTIVLRIMQRFPIVILIGGGLLGFIAGEMLVTDPAIHRWVEGMIVSWFTPDLAPGSEAHAAWLQTRVHRLELVVGAVGAALTLGLGLYVKRRAARRAVRDLGAGQKEGGEPMALTTDILVPVDGSANSDRAVRFAMTLLPKGAKLHLVNVRPRLGGDVTAFVRTEDLDSFRRDEGAKALASAIGIAKDANVPFEQHIAAGSIGAIVSEFAGRSGAGMIVMGTRGLSGFAGALLGSAAQDVIAAAKVPVCLVK